MPLIRWGNRAVTAITPHAGNRTVLIPPKKGTSTPPDCNNATVTGTNSEGSADGSIRFCYVDEPDPPDPPPPTSGSFPRLGVAAIGGWGSTGLDNRPGGMPGRMARIAAHDISIVGTHRDWTYSGVTGPDKNRTDIVPYIKTFNANTKVLCYTFGGTDIRPDSMINPWPATRTKWNAETWYLYDGNGFVYPDNVEVPSGNFPDDMGNHSDWAPLDAAGVSPAQWTARAEHANSTDSGDWVTPGWGLRSEYGFDGVFQDIMRFKPRTGGDWSRDGNRQSNSHPESYQGKSEGDKNYHAEWDILEPTFIHAGNYTQNAGTAVNQSGLDDYNQAIASGYQNLVHGAYMEQMLGRSSSIETFSTWDALMRYYKRSMTLVAGMNPNYVFFDNWQVDGFSESDPNIWDSTHSLYEWGRYGLCTCLQDDGYYGFPTSGGFVDANVLDEYSFNLGDALAAPDYDGTDPATSLVGSGYNAKQNGVHWREFENGIAIVNPKGNGNQTVVLPSPGAGFRWDRLNAADYANQEPSVNDGATNVTSQFLEQRKGIILKRTAI